MSIMARTPCRVNLFLDPPLLSLPPGAHSECQLNRKPSAGTGSARARSHLSVRSTMMILNTDRPSSIHDYDSRVQKPGGDLPACCLAPRRQSQYQNIQDHVSFNKAKTEHAACQRLTTGKGTNRILLQPLSDCRDTARDRPNVERPTSVARFRHSSGMRPLN